MYPPGFDSIISNQNAKAVLSISNGSNGRASSSSCEAPFAYVQSTDNSNLLRCLVVNGFLGHQVDSIQGVSTGAVIGPSFHNFSSASNSKSIHPVQQQDSFKPAAVMFPAGTVSNNFAAASAASSCALSRWMRTELSNKLALPPPLMPVQRPMEFALQDVETLTFNSVSGSAITSASNDSAFLRSQDHMLSDQSLVQQDRQLSLSATHMGLFAVSEVICPSSVNDNHQDSVHSLGRALFANFDPSSAPSSATNKSARFRRDQAEQWMEKYNELIVFLKLHGHCCVPRNQKHYGPLSSWVKRQRYQYKLRKEGKTSYLTDERVAILDRVGFVWDSHGCVWEERFQELQDFQCQFGHSNVPYNHRNAKLASWIKAQRREMRAFKEGKTIAPEMLERFLKLEKLGFCWQLRSVTIGRKSQSKEVKKTAES